MPHATRRVDDCPFRQPCSGDDSTARCGLLEELTGGDAGFLCRVARDACEACCKTFAPTADEMNPVIASLLYEISSEIAAAGGVEGCTREQAEALNHLASEYVLWEHDCLDTPSGKELASSNATLVEVIPPPSRRSGPRVKRWAVGVTTAPRPLPTLAECLTSLGTAGWPDPRLFVDGTLDLPEPFQGLPRSVRIPKLGAWPSYYLALAELLMRDPQADAYLLVQDDVVFAAGFDVRTYLEQVLWPGKSPAIVSLFCPRPYTHPNPGWYPFEDHWIWGAQAFAFSPEAARAFLGDPGVVRHRDTRERNPLADIDWCVGQWASRHQQPIYYPTPSLVQHIGQISSLWKGRRPWGYRRASWLARKKENDPNFLGE
jgi:hypothetical protein